MNTATYFVKFINIFCMFTCNNQTFFEFRESRLHIINSGKSKHNELHT